MVVMTMVMELIMTAFTEPHGSSTTLCQSYNLFILTMEQMDTKV